jgi:hypothetical protein
VPGQTAPRPTIGRLSEAEALALQRAEGPQVRIAEPKKSDPAAAKRAADQAKARYEAEYQQALAAGKAFSDQELQQLNEAADKKIRLEEEVNAEKIRILQEGAEAAAKLQQKQEAFVQSTGAGQLNALRERSRQLTQALDVGLIDEAGYDAELKKIGDEMAKLQLDGNAAFKDLKETGKDTLKDLEFAIQGWGRQASAAFADMVVSGTASFEDLRDVAKNVVRDILAMVVQKNILDPAIKAGAAVLGNVFSSITGGGSSGGGGGGLPAIGRRGRLAPEVEPVDQETRDEEQREQPQAPVGRGVIDLVPWVYKKPVDAITNNRVFRALQNPIDGCLVLLFAGVLIDEHQTLIDPGIGLWFIFAAIVRQPEHVTDVGNRGHLEAGDSCALPILPPVVAERGQQVESPQRLT